MTLVTIRSIADLRAQVQSWRSEGLSVGLVPTMGALHDGHLTLARTALSQCDRVIATVFVNPTQFGPNEDFDAYPRTEETDREKLNSVGVQAMFCPPVGEMYPDGATTRVSVPGIGDLLEGEFRPGFFTGVATIVTKLLLQALPDKAFFGEKDYQQLQVIKQFTRDLNIPVEICGVPTVREESGLAMSSRNAYLDSKQRAAAATLFRVISTVRDRFKQGESEADLFAWSKAELEANGFGTIDYVTVRHAKTLQPVTSPNDPIRVLAAVRMGKARLIDNVG